MPSIPPNERGVTAAPSPRDQVALHVRGLCRAPSIWPSPRGCAFHALADREAFAPQDLATLLITLDLVSHSAGRFLFSSGGQLSAVTQGLDVARGICHRSRSRRVARDPLDTTARVKLNRLRHPDGRVDRLARLGMHGVEPDGLR